MHARIALMLALALTSCATASVPPQAEGAFSVKDYLKTAYDTLLVADPDTEGHRIRAQLETRAALAAFDDGAPTKRVPFVGPPSLHVALELLERSAQDQTLNVIAATHTQRAVAELRQAVGFR